MKMHTELEQKQVIEGMLKSSPVEIAEGFVSLYEDEFIKEFTHSEDKEMVKAILNLVKDELANVSVRYALNTGYTMSNFYQNKELIHKDHVELD